MKEAGGNQKTKFDGFDFFPTFGVMSALAKEIEKRALGLSAVERVSLAEKLLASLDSPIQFSFDEKWANESEDRIQAFERGELASSEAAMVFERLEKKYGK